MTRTMFKIMKEVLKSTEDKKKNNIVFLGKYQSQENQLNEYYGVSCDNSILVFKQITKEIEGKFIFFKQFFKEEIFHYDFLGTLSPEDNPCLLNKKNISHLYLDKDSLDQIENKLTKNDIANKIESFAEMLCKYYNHIEIINRR